MARKSPNAPVEVWHRTATVCHLVNIVRELGRTIERNPDQEIFTNDTAANLLRDRRRRKGFQ